VRLPTEAEWEYACRGGTTTRYFTGDGVESLEKSANIADASLMENNPFADWAVAWDDNYAFTSPVGKFRPNPFGLYDMMGNAWEWCSDYYDTKYYINSAKEDPENLTKSSARVLRGGSFDAGSGDCRAAFRAKDAPADRHYSVGFRVRVRLD
jgi:formylglycine-generating enzyme required for sulfatase activity